MELGEMNKYKNKIFNIAIIILGLIIAANIYKSQSGEMALLRQTEDAETKKNAVLESISRLEKESRAYKDLLAKKDAGSVMNTINNIAKESAVRIISIRPLPAAVYPDYTKLPFELVLSSAGYYPLGNFISKIESYADVYMIETMGIKSEGQKEELRVDLKLSSIAFTD